MRVIQIVGLFLGVIAFGAAALCVGSENGDTLWRAGVAILLTDIVLILLAGSWQPKV
jgi:hypothetical protein